MSNRMEMSRSPGQWALMVPEIVAEGSRAQVVFALRDAKKDIAGLLVFIEGMRQSTKRKTGRADSEGTSMFYGVGRVEDNDQALSLVMRRRPTDDEIRSLHEYLRLWRP